MNTHRMHLSAILKAAAQWGIAVILLSFSLPGQLAAKSASVEPLYNKLCGVCHGNQGDGRGRAGANLSSAPTDFTRVKSAADLRQRYIKIIREGRAGTAMVAYQRRLDEQQIVALADFILERFVSGNKPVDRGEQLYREHCSACHGDNGNTAVWAKNGLNPPPRNFTSAQAREELSRERMISSVTHGRPGTAMMSFQARLDDAQIAEVVDFIRQRFMSAPVLESSLNARAPAHPQVVENVAKTEVQVDHRAGFPRTLSGDAQAGGEFYQANCYSCHGRQGKGDGPRAHFNIPRPRDFTSAQSFRELNRPRLFTSISYGRPGSVMPAWRQVLTDQQIADVAEYVFQQFVLKKK